ncbi:hypothetical protein FKM82_027578 [Ascaphus truei]
MGRGLCSPAYQQEWRPISTRGALASANRREARGRGVSHRLLGFWRQTSSFARSLLGGRHSPSPPSPLLSMSGFDDPGVYYSDSFGGEQPVGDDGQAKRSQLQKRFREFLRQYRVGTDRTGFTFKYR